MAQQILAHLLRYGRRACRLIPYPFFRVPNFMVIGSQAQNKVTKKGVWYEPSDKVLTSKQYQLCFLKIAKRTYTGLLGAPEFGHSHVGLRFIWPKTGGP